LLLLLTLSRSGLRRKALIVCFVDPAACVSWSTTAHKGLRIMKYIKVLNGRNANIKLHYQVFIDGNDGCMQE
jgi:hypothetical protein